MSVSWRKVARLLVVKRNREGSSLSGGGFAPPVDARGRLVRLLGGLALGVDGEAEVLGLVSRSARHEG